MGFVAIEAQKCVQCQKSAYAAEKIEWDQRHYHKKCFRCTQCQCQLTALNVAVFDQKIFCKTHFKEKLGSAGGKYDVAFDDDAMKKSDGVGGSDAAAAAKTNVSSSSMTMKDAKKELEKTASAAMNGDSKDSCVCCKTVVYAAEAVNAVLGGKKVHKRCFKCAECQVTLNLNTFVFDKDTNKLYCKQHTPKMQAHFGLDAVYGIQKAEQKVSHLGGRQVMPKVEFAPQMTLDAIVGANKPDLRSFSIGRNVMPGNEAKALLKTTQANKENEKKPEPVDFSPNATPSSAKKAEQEKKVFTLETPPLTASVEAKNNISNNNNKKGEKTSHEMSIKKSASKSTESLSSQGSEEIAKKQLIEALSSVSINEENVPDVKMIDVDASLIEVLATTTVQKAQKVEPEKVLETPSPLRTIPSSTEPKVDPYAGMTKSQMKKAKEREKMRAKEQAKYEKELEKKQKELDFLKKKEELLNASSENKKPQKSFEELTVPEKVEHIEPTPPPPPEPSSFYLIKPPGAKSSAGAGELLKDYELDKTGKLVQSPSFSDSSAEKKKKKEKNPPQETFLPAKSETSWSAEGAKIFKEQSKKPTNIVPPESNIGANGSISPEAKVSPRRSIGSIAPQPMSSPTVTAPEAETISKSPGEDANNNNEDKKKKKKTKLKPGQALALDEKKTPNLEEAHQVYSFKELQASGFAFEHESHIRQESESDNSESESQSEQGTPRLISIEDPKTPSTINITPHNNNNNNPFST
jgi:hypothetical protein